MERNLLNWKGLVITNECWRRDGEFTEAYELQQDQHSPATETTVIFAGLAGASAKNDRTKISETTPSQQSPKLFHLNRTGHPPHLSQYSSFFVILPSETIRCDSDPRPSRSPRSHRDAIIPVTHQHVRSTARFKEHSHFPAFATTRTLRTDS